MSCFGRRLRQDGAATRNCAMKKKLISLTCRMIEQEDVKEVAALHCDAFFNVDEKEIAARVRGKKERAMVCLSGSGKIEGYVLFDCESQGGERRMYVANVGVREKSRNKGVCGTMLPWLMKRLGRYKCQLAHLVVSNSNDSAIRCYERAGFRLTKRSSMNRMEYRPAKNKKSKGRKKGKAA